MDKEKIYDEYISRLVQTREFDEPDFPDLSNIKKNNIFHKNKNITYQKI